MLTTVLVVYLTSKHKKLFVATQTMESKKGWGEILNLFLRLWWGVICGDTNNGVSFVGTQTTAFSTVVKVRKAPLTTVKGTIDQVKRPLTITTKNTSCLITSRLKTRKTATATKFRCGWRFLPLSCLGCLCHNLPTRTATLHWHYNLQKNSSVLPPCVFAN
jgi:hypothetical protein